MTAYRRPVPGGSTIEDLVHLLIPGTSAYAVEVNQQLISRDRLSTTSLAEGDIVEIATLAGGG